MEVMSSAAAHPLQFYKGYLNMQASCSMYHVAPELHLNCLYSPSIKVVHGTMLTQQVAAAVGRDESIFAVYYFAC